MVAVLEASSADQAQAWDVTTDCKAALRQQGSRVVSITTSPQREQVLDVRTKPRTICGQIRRRLEVEVIPQPVSR